MGTCVVGAGSSGDAGTDSPASPPLALAGQRWLLPCTGPDPAVPPDPSLCMSGNSLQTVTLGGAAGQHFTVTVRIRGVFEVSPFTGGTATSAIGWYEGGTIGDNYHSDARLTISAPARIYHLNYSLAATDVVAPLDYTASFTIDGGATAAFEINGQDAKQLRNLDANGTPLTIPGVATTPSPYDGQFLQLDVVDVK